MQKFINHYSKGPHIRFGPIYVVPESLRRHINRGADVDILEFLSTLIKYVLGEFCKTEISNFSFAIMHKYICYFQVSMNHIF